MVTQTESNTDIQVEIFPRTHAFLTAQTDAGRDWLKLRAKPVTHLSQNFGMVHLSFLEENLQAARNEGLVVEGDYEIELIA